jgi:hypothetical protein
MSNQLREGTLRVSYVEDVEINKAIKLLAMIRGLTMSDVIREATKSYLKTEDPSSRLTATASLLLDDAGAGKKGVNEMTDQDVSQLNELIKKLGKKKTK